MTARVPKAPPEPLTLEQARELMLGLAAHLEEVIAQRVIAELDAREWTVAAPTTPRRVRS